MPCIKPARRYALLAVVVVVIADVVAMFLLDGRVPQALQWAVQGAILLLLAAYVLLYVREHRSPRLQFGTATIFVLVTLAAMDAWAWRSRAGGPFTMMLVAGLLLYWRIWIRRTEPVGWLTTIILCGLMFLFLLSSMFVTSRLLDSPKPRKNAASNQHPVTPACVDGTLRFDPATVGTLGVRPLC
jgi:hypothetical protein